jgi:hypothetical protein
MAVTFKSILSDIGKGLQKFFTVAVKVGQAAEPFVDIAFPGISGLYNATVNAVAAAENAAIAAGQQNGTGAQKLAYVVGVIEADFNAYAAANGIATPSQTVIENWVNAVVAGLNAIPSSTAAPVAAVPAVPAVPAAPAAPAAPAPAPGS